MHPVGYKWLMSKMELKAIPHFCESYISEKNRHLTVQKDGLVQEHYPKTKTVEDNFCGHLEFAVKNEGINLGILKACFQKLDPAELTEHIRKKPTGKFGRILWFLYEELIGEKLDLPDLKQGNYVDLLDPTKYFTGSSVPHPRQRVNMNLPGTLFMSPFVRKTEKILAGEAGRLDERCREILAEYPPELVARVTNLNFLGETRSTNDIEKEVLSPDRTRRFRALLEKAGTEHYLSHDGLLRLHRQIVVDPRFQTELYRETQEYIGPEAIYSEPEVDFIPPRPQELTTLMESFFECAERIMNSTVHSVVKATTLSFLFVYIHPFRDGNGRIHRFLIHHILSKTEFAPRGNIFPVSQIMRDDIQQYRQVLNVFSNPLMERVRYTQDSVGRMTVLNDTSDYYRYIDLTAATEFLFDVIGKTLERDLVQKLNSMIRSDRAKRGLVQLFDGMPDREINLLIQVCLQHGYPLSKNNREKYFSMLTDDEVREAERLIQVAFEE